MIFEFWSKIAFLNLFSKTYRIDELGGVGRVVMSQDCESHDAEAGHDLGHPQQRTLLFREDWYFVPGWKLENTILQQLIFNDPSSFPCSVIRKWTKMF